MYACSLLRGVLRPIAYEMILPTYPNVGTVEAVPLHVPFAPNAAKVRRTEAQFPCRWASYAGRSMVSLVCLQRAIVQAQRRSRVLDEG